MWPLTADLPGLWLGLYLLTLALHAVFVGYVLIGTGYACVQSLRRVDDPVADQVRDWLPFMLGCGITAGVAPLLFLQLLYQRAFYTANLLMGPRWGAVVPALIVGFYGLYLAKASPKWRRIALAVATACFLFVAWSWTELHLLMQDQPAWKRMYAAGDRLYANTAVVPRLLLWIGVMTTLFATVSAWAQPSRRPRLAMLGIAGRVVAGGALAWIASSGGLADTHGWAYLLAIAVAVELAGWIWVVRAPAGNGLLVVTGAGTAALVAGVVVREAPRIAMLEPSRGTQSGGLWVFLVTFVGGVLAIGWIARTVSAGTRSAD